MVCRPWRVLTFNGIDLRRGGEECAARVQGLCVSEYMSLFGKRAGSYWYNYIVSLLLVGYSVDISKFVKLTGRGVKGGQPRVQNGRHGSMSANC